MCLPILKSINGMVVVHGCHAMCTAQLRLRICISITEGHFAREADHPGGLASPQPAAVRAAHSVLDIHVSPLQVMTTHPTWQVYAGHSKSRLLVVKPDRMQGQKSVSVFLESNPQKDFVSAADFSVRSDMGAHNMWIYAKNQPIAEVSLSLAETQCAGFVPVTYGAVVNCVVSFPVPRFAYIYIWPGGPAGLEIRDTASLPHTAADGGLLQASYPSPQHQACAPYAKMLPCASCSVIIRRWTASLHEQAVFHFCMHA